MPRVAKPLWANMTPSRQNKLGKGRARQRSRTYAGIAAGMAQQWGILAVVLALAVLVP